MALLQELRTAIGFKRQTDLVTPLTAADMWSLRQTNRSVPQPILMTENDKEDIGKGIWTTMIYPTNWDVAFPWEAYLTSENAAQVCAFALGKVTETVAGTGTQYVIKPLDQNADCLQDMPTTTYLSYLASCNEDVIDTALLGVGCESFMIRLASGPGRANSTMTSNWVGTGNFVSPSTIIVPAFTTEHSLNAGGTVTLNINGNDYIVNKKFVSAEFGYANAIKLDQGFYPGSGSTHNASIRGRMRRGVPTVTLNFVAEFEHDSNELDLFYAQTTGTATIKIDGAVIGAGPQKHSLQAVFAKVVFRAAVIGENDNTLTLAVECEVLQDTTTGDVVTITVVTEKPGVLTPAAAEPPAAAPAKKAA
jgi:hypothetical protein